MPWLVADVETSQKTRYSEAKRITKSTTIGNGTWGSYLAEHQDATLNVQPRMRVLTIHHPLIGTYAWDLDVLPPGSEQRRQLLAAVIHDKILIGHNLGFDLSWMFGESEARPRFVLDSMLLVRQVKPKILNQLFRNAATGTKEQRKIATEMIQRTGKQVSAKLAYVAACLGMEVPDKTYQKPQNWCVTPLSRQHFDYAAGDVSQPLEILHFLFPRAEVEEMPAIIEQRYSWYLPFEKATVRLAEAHTKGVSFNFEAAKNLKAKKLAALVSAADELLRIPEFGKIPRDILVNPAKGESQEMKLAMAQHAELHGVVMPGTETGNISTNRDAMVAAGSPKMPGWSPYDSLKAAKKALGTIAEYVRAASTDGRIHSIITCNTATGRMSSKDPNLQNVPGDDDWRALINADSNHCVAAIDYSAIEMRLAVGLAEVAIADIRARVARHDTESWFMRMVLVGYHCTHRLVDPPEPAGPWTIPWLEETIPAVAQMVLGRKQQAMAAIFHRDLEPHLSTALIMANQAGLLDTAGMPVLDWLAVHNEKGVEALKEQWKAWRQKAKAINFGLLYGMSAATLHERGITDYNLTWTLEEATKVRNDWFNLYPEIRLWHFWIKYITSVKLGMETVMVWDNYHHNDDDDDDEDDRERMGKLKWPEHGARLYQPTTLVGRPFAILDGFKEARNYPDQGSGADILVRAIAMLPVKIAKMLRLPCHDELLFEVPAEEIDEVLRIVEDVMVQAGDQVLKHVIPVKVEAQVGPTWAKPAKIRSPILQVEAA